MSDSLETQIEGLSNNYLTCRDLGHAWKLMSTYRTDGGLPLRILKCRTCPTERKEIVGNDGELVRRSYNYPQGYRFTPGTVGRGGMSKSYFRREWLKRNAKEIENA